MSAIDKHVDVQITKETATVSRVGFGTPAVLTYHTRFAEAYRLYGSLSEMTDDGFTTSDMAYRMVAAIFSQSPRPSSVVVGRRTTAAIRDVKLTPKTPLLASTAYTVGINGTDFTYTTDATPTASEITLGLTTLINAGTENVLATDNTTDMDVEKAVTPGGAATAGEAYSIEFDHTKWDFNDNTADASLDTDITTLNGATTDWYGLCVDLWDANNIGDAALTIESLGPKIFFAETQDTDVVESGSSDIASTLQTAAYDRTALMYNHTLDPSPAAGWLGKQLPTDPGSTTFKFKTLATVVPSSLTTGETTFADSKSCNTYQETGGINITQEGVMCSGEFIDVTRFIDWLTARTKENVYRALAVNDKIPYTNNGIQTIVTEIEGVLRQGIDNGGINPDEDFTVTAPLASEVPAATRATRILSDVRFLATLAGAIHKTVIRGTVTA